MSLLIGIALVSTLGVAYIGRKGWYAFHRAVGITPGTLTYTPSSEPLALPNLMQLTLDDAVLRIFLQNYWSNYLVSIIRQIFINNG